MANLGRGYFSYPTRNLSRRWSCCRFARLIRIDVVALFVLVLLSICNSGGRRNDTALGRDARLGLSALDNFCACMRELGRFKHCVQVGATAGVAKRSECDDDHCNDDRDRNITVPTSRIESAAASRPAANITERSVVLEL